MKKRTIILSLLLILTACGQGTTEEQQPQDFRTGTEGLTFRFAPNLPPPRLYDTETFSALIEVENRGTYDLGGVGDAIFLSGFDATIIQGIDTYGKPIPLLEGRGPFIPQGGFDTINFKGTLRSLYDKRIDKYQATLLATACYGYETVASANVCIDPNPYAPTRQQKICTPSTVSTGSQGAPIAVTSVEVNPSPGRTRFKINIQNVGIGDVFRYGGQFLANCNPHSAGLTYEEVDYVRVADVTISGLSIRQSCKPLDSTGHLRLTNGAGALYCEFTQMRGQSTFTTPLNVILDYGYRQSLTQQLEIRPTA